LPLQTQQDTIPVALNDRMEKLYLPGYINPEKIQIAKRFLIPRQIKENGLKAKYFDIYKKSYRYYHI